MPQSSQCSFDCWVLGCFISHSLIFSPSLSFSPLLSPSHSFSLLLTPSLSFSLLSPQVPEMKKEDKKVSVQLSNKGRERPMNLQEAISCLEMAMRWQNGFSKVLSADCGDGNVWIFCPVRRSQLVTSLRRNSMEQSS